MKSIDACRDSGRFGGSNIDLPLRLGHETRDPKTSVSFFQPGYSQTSWTRACIQVPKNEYTEDEEWGSKRSSPSTPLSLYAPLNPSPVRRLSLYDPFFCTIFFLLSASPLSVALTPIWAVPISCLRSNLDSLQPFIVPSSRHEPASWFHYYYYSFFSGASFFAPSRPLSTLFSSSYPETRLTHSRFYRHSRSTYTSPYSLEYTRITLH